MKSNWTQYLIIIASSMFFITSCSDEGLDDYVTLYMVPDSPVIVYSDTVIENSDQFNEITAPWFVAGFEIENDHDEYILNVPTLRLEYTGYYQGSVYRGGTEIDASTFCSSVENSARGLYATVLPGEIFYGDLNCNGVNAGPLDKETTYFYDLPVPENYDGQTIVYDIKVTLSGYFEDGDGNIRGNVEIVRYFSSQ